jgi:ribonuclease HII
MAMMRASTTGHKGAQDKTRPRRRVRAPRPGLVHERLLWGDGHRVVAGVDEVGRGAWAGPLSVGVAVLCESPDRVLRGLRESKQLTEEAREAMFDRVAAWCAAWAVGHAEADECDRLGMTACLRLATRRAFAQLAPDLAPEAVVLDGSFDFVSPPVAPQLFDPDDDPPFDVAGAANLPEAPPASVVEPPATVRTVVGGDARCASVAAASVLAKVTRDRIMRAHAEHHPPFDFERNKGYPSPAHQRALCGYGLSALHRRSWAFVGSLPWELTTWPGRFRPLDPDGRHAEEGGGEEEGGVEEDQVDGYGAEPEIAGAAPG